MFLALASLARDVLSIPATGAGVERLFNTARDVCHYRRGSFSSKTIQDIMTFLCRSLFEIEGEERTLIDEYLSNQEIQAANEEKELQTQMDFVPISDYEKDYAFSAQCQPTPEVPSQHRLGKRRNSVVSEHGNQGSNELIVNAEH